MLRRHIARGTHGNTSICLERRSFDRDVARDPKIDQCHLVAIVVFTRDENVSGLEIAVDDTLVVEVLQANEHLLDDVRRVVDVELVMLSEMSFERLPIQERHHEKQLAVGQRSKVVDLDDIAVVESRRCRGFTLETCTDHRVVRELAEQNLDDLLGRQDFVNGQVNHSHTSLRDLLADDVVADHEADQGIVHG